MTNNVLTQNATKEEIKDWLKLKDKRVEVDPGDKVDMMTKIKQVINEGIEKSKTSNDDSTDTPDDTQTNNSNGDGGDNNKVVITENGRNRTVEITYRGGVTSTSWKVTFNLDEGQRLDQVGFSNLLMKILGDNVIFDGDRQIFWIYDSRRWVPLNNKAQDLRQFTRQATDIFIENTLCVNYDVSYDCEQAFYLNVEKPDQDDSESDKAFKQRMADYKIEVAKVKRYNKFLDFIQRGTVIDQAIKDLKALMSKSNIDWDDDDFLLNVNNGVIDLKTGKLMPHDKKLYLTRIAPVNYDPKATHPVLDRTLESSFPHDEELQRYLQQEAGYFIVGGNRDEKLFLWYGPTARNGKSVLANTIAKILGADKANGSGYAKTTPVETFLGSKYGDDGKAADPNLAGLAGVRLAVASEPDRNSRLASGKVKMITGDQQITARFLHEDPTTFKTKFKILISCNFLPTSDGDASIKRRMNITPFNHHIKSGSLEDDPFIMDKLWREREGILNWMVEGAIKNEQKRQQQIKDKQELIKEVQSKGLSLEDVDKEAFEDPLLPMPQSMIDAVDSYIYSANSVSQFLHESTISKHEYWEYLVETVFTKFNEGNYLHAYPNGSDATKMNFDKKYFQEQKLVCLPQAYTLRSNLYKMYQNYCENNGIQHPVSAHNFYDMAKRYLLEAKTNAGRVFLGVTPTPTPGDQDYHYNDKFNKWVPSTSDFKDRIYKAATRAKTASQTGNVDMLEKAYRVNISLSDCDKASNFQVDKLADAVNVNPDLYFGKMIGTYDDSDIDFEKELDRIKGISDLVDKEKQTTDSKHKQAIFY